MGIANIEHALVIAPHADDETFGCGGTIAKLTSQGVQVNLFLGTLGENAKTIEIRQAELGKAIHVLGMNTHVKIAIPYMEGGLDCVSQYSLIDPIEHEIGKGKYDVVFIPYPSHHQDHIVMHQACMAALRPGAFQPKMILMYEYTYPTWVVPDQYNGRFFVDISETIKKKIEALKMYKSYLRDDNLLPVSTGAVTVMAETRGLSIGVPFAEMFYVIQMKNIL